MVEEDDGDDLDCDDGRELLLVIEQVDLRL